MGLSPSLCVTNQYAFPNESMGGFGEKKLGENITSFLGMGGGHVVASTWSPYW
jgi:hypothetical protein